MKIINSVNNMMDRTRLFLRFTIAVLLVSTLAGCNNKFWDPTQIGRFRPVPVQHVILDSLGIAEEESPVYEGAEDPKPKDILYYEEDYRFNAGDVVRISIYELLDENQQFINDYVVTETGKISIPEVGSVQAGGLTEKQLEEEIKQILTPNILKSPAVTVILQSSQKRVFSIFGQGLLGNAGRYSIPRYNFRLAEAISIAGGISEYNVSYIYITRELTPQEIVEKMKSEEVLTKTNSSLNFKESDLETFEPIKPKIRKDDKSENELLEMIAPFGGSVDDSVVAMAQVDGDIEVLDALTVKNENDISTVESESQSEIGEKIEWVFEDGKWVPVKVGADQVKEIVTTQKQEEIDILEEKIPETIDEFDEIAQKTRVIKIPYDKLVSGDPKYNIIIKAGDTISVPVDVIGECVIMGNVNAQGYIALTGRPMTLMQAIAAAGGLGALAAPENIEVRRRIGRKKEEIVQVNLKKIAEGLQPDFFIKKDDTINVGTEATATWKAVLRNAFRASYGFGFVYDRNYGDRDFDTSRPFSFF